MTAHGATAAIAELVDEHAEDDREDAQLGLFAPPASECGQQLALAKGWNGVGRKPGSRNKRTTDIVEFVLARHRHPLIVLAEIAEANVYDLAALYKCSPHEAGQEKRLAAIGLLPYVSAKITRDVIDPRGAIYLTINSGAAVISSQPSEGAIVLRPDEYQVETEAASEAVSADTQDNSGD